MLFQSDALSSRPRLWLPWVCASVNLALLVWMVHVPAAMVIAPVSTRYGENGRAVNEIYFQRPIGSTTAVSTRADHLTFPSKAKTKTKSRRAPLERVEVQAQNVEALPANEKPMGNPYGSLGYGSYTGADIRPALPLFSPDPILGTELSAIANGDEIIEITIDEQGNIVATNVLQSLGPGIDQRILGALAQWRFQPATRNGVAIPSKQDVHYHFPR